MSGMSLICNTTLKTPEHELGWREEFHTPFWLTERCKPHLNHAKVTASLPLYSKTLHNACIQRRCMKTNSRETVWISDIQITVS